MMYEHIHRLLVTQDIDFTLHEHPPIRTVEEAQANLPFPTDQLLKTLAFRVRDGGWILASLKGLDRLDYRRLAEAAGVPRGALLGATPDEVTTVLGCEVGAVSPIPLDPNTTVLFDDATATMDVVYTGSGRTDRTLEVRMADLLRVVSPRIVPLRSGVSGAMPPSGGGWGRGTTRQSEPLTGRDGAEQVSQVQEDADGEA